MKNIIMPVSLSSLILSTGRTFSVRSNSRPALNFCRNLSSNRLSQNLQHSITVGSSSSRRSHYWLPFLLMTSSSMAAISNSTKLSTMALCDGDDNDDDSGTNNTISIVTQPFPESLLEHDHYHGITLRLDRVEKNEETPKFLEDPEMFASSFKTALEIWRAEGRKGIWVHVPDRWASVIPKLSECGFRFHFCHSGGILVLSKWLPTSESRLPFGPTHQAGVGALVLHPEDPSLMLVVQEKTGPAAARKLWKMPTGLLDPGEDIHDAAERELLEETTLRASFQGILAFRQAHGSRGTGRSTSDLFFVCLMKLQSPTDLDNLKLQEEEIKDIKWMTVDEFAGQEVWQGSPLYQELNKAMVDAVKSNSFMVNKTLPVGFSRGSNSIYRSNI